MVLTTFSADYNMHLHTNETKIMVFGLCNIFFRYRKDKLLSFLSEDTLYELLKRI